MSLNQMACLIIANAGEGHSYAKTAIMFAKENKYDEARECLKKCEECILEAHKVHTDLLTLSAKNADEIQVNFLMVHASNHLSFAQSTKEIAELFVEVLEEVRRK